MKFSITSKKLKDGIDSVLSVIPRKCPLPALTHTKATLVGNSLTLAGTDLETTLFVNLEVKGIEDGEALLNPFTFKELLKKTKDDTLEISVDKQNRVHVKADFTGTKITLDSEDIEGYPKLPDPIQETCNIDGFILHRGISKTRTFASTDELRPQLSGVLFEIERNSIRIVATDGHRLARYTAPLDTPISSNFILPSKACQILEKFLKPKRKKDPFREVSINLDFPEPQKPESNNPLKCESCLTTEKVGVFKNLNTEEFHLFCPNCVINHREQATGRRIFRTNEPIPETPDLPTQASFTFGNLTLTTRLIEGRYPNYAAVIPQSNDNILTCNRKELMDTTARIGQFANEVSRQVQYHLNGFCKVEAEDVEAGTTAEEEFAGEFNGDDMTIGFNAGYVLDILKQIDTENIRGEFGTPTTAALIKPSYEQDDEIEDDLLYLVMPVRLS